MRQLLSHIVSLVLLAWVLLACNSRPEHVQTIDQLPAIYPDYIGVTIPVGIAPLNFSMADDDFTDIDVEIKGKKGGSLHANGSFADFFLAISRKKCTFAPKGNLKRILKRKKER